MKKINYLGMLSLLSLIAILGWKTGNTGLYGFFGFAYYIRYFWIIPDELFQQNVQKSATFAFYVYLFNALRYFFFYPYGFWVKFCCCYLHIYDYFNDTGMERAKRGAGMIKNRIKEYRARYDMKQEDLAKLVGVRRETIGNLEKGRYNPSLVLAWNIAKVFNVTIEEIFTVE